MEVDEGIPQKVWYLNPFFLLKNLVVKMPRGFGPVMGPMHGRKGFGWLFLPFALLIIFVKLAFLLLPFIVIGFIIYALMR